MSIPGRQEMDVYRVGEMNPQIGAEICFGNCMDVQRNLLEYLRGVNGSSKGIVIDHEGVERVDSSWTASLVKVAASARQRSLPLVLKNVSPHVRHLLNIQRLEFLFESI